MDIHENLRDNSKTHRNVHLSSQLSPFSMDIPRDIPGNLPMLGLGVALSIDWDLIGSLMSRDVFKH